MSSRMVAVTGGVSLGSMSAALSYGAGTSSSISTVNVASSESMVLAVAGAGLGLSSWTSVSGVGRTVCEATVWASDRSLVCMSSRSLSASLRTTLTAGLVSGSASAMFSADSPSLSMPSTSNLASGLPLSITVVGRGQGIFDVTVRLSDGQTASEMTAWVSDTSMHGRTGPGLRGSHRLMITAGLQQGGTVTEIVSTDAVSVSMPYGSNAASDAAVMLTVHGSSFGLASRSPGISTGLTSCEATSWLSETSTRCLSSGVIGTSLRVTTTAGLLSGSVTEGFSADGLWKMSTSMLGNAFSTGSIGMTVVGIGIGLAQYSQVLQVGGSASERTYWQSDSSIRCQSSQGRMSSRMVAVTGGVSLGSMSVALSYDSGTSSSISTANVPYRISDVNRFMVYGQALGPKFLSAYFSIGNSVSSFTYWISDSSVFGLVGKTGVVVFGSLRIVMSMNAAICTLSEVFTFDSAQLVNVSSQNYDTSTMFSEILRISSSAQVQNLYSGKVLIGGTSCEATRWNSESTILCKGTVGMHKSRGISITYGIQVSSLSAAITFETGNIVSGNSSSSYSTLGGDSVTIFGNSISQHDGSPVDSAGLTRAETTKWVSDSSLLSKLSSGVGGKNRLIITTGVVPTTKFEGFAYSAPEIFQRNVTSNNNRTFKVFGSWCAAEYGICSCQGIVSFLELGGSYSSAVSDSYRDIVCSSSQFNLNQDSDLSRINTCYCFNRPFMGGAILTLSGDGFGKNDYTLSVQIGISSASSTKWFSQSSLLCQIPTCSNCSATSSSQIIVSVSQQVSITSNVPNKFEYNVSNNNLCPSFWVDNGDLALNHSSGILCRVSSRANERITWIINPCDGSSSCDNVMVGNEVLGDTLVPARNLFQTELVFSEFEVKAGGSIEISSCSESSCARPWAQLNLYNGSHLPLSAHGNPYLMVSWSVSGNDGLDLNRWTATWTSSYNRTFVFFDIPETYDSAAESCLGLTDGGLWYLASISSELENIVLNFSQFGDAWVGFRKESKANLTRHFAWADNSPSDYFDCNSGSTCRTQILMNDTRLVAYYSFTADAFVNDSSGYGRTLIPSASPPSHNTTHCLWGSGCAYFAETNSNIPAENESQSFALGPLELGVWPNLSICLWFFVSLNSNTESSHTLVQLGYHEAMSMFLGNLNGSTSIIFSLHNASGSSLLELETGNIYIPEQWSHICITLKERSEWSIYVNGSKISSKSLDHQMAANFVTYSNTIGSSTDNTPFSGLMDDFRIYSRTLSPPEINNLTQWRGGDCAAVNFDNLGTWRDDDCGTLKPYICSRK